MSASSETNDLPLSHQNRDTRGGRITENGRSAGGALPYPTGQIDMETQIHWLEKEAYISVLHAFKAQSDAITWKESLITELRKELRVSDKEHRELLTRVNADDIRRRVREWQQAGGLQSGLLNNAQDVHDSIPSPTFSASQMRQKASQSMPSLSLDVPSPVMNTQTITAPSSSAAIRGAPLGSKGKKSKSIPSIGPSGKGQVTNGNSSGALTPSASNPLIGRKVWTKWPEDNNFYEAVITDYNPHEISPEDIQWEGKDLCSGAGIKKPMGQGGAITGVGRVRRYLKSQSDKDLAPMNGLVKKHSDDIEILHTETLIKEVQGVFTANHPDPHDVENVKKTLEENEQALIDAIGRLNNVLGGKSEEDHRQ